MRPFGKCVINVMLHQFAIHQLKALWQPNASSGYDDAAIERFDIAHVLCFSNQVTRGGSRQFASKPAARLARSARSCRSPRSLTW